MSNCAAYQDQLADYAADAVAGSRASRDHAALQQHLTTCRACRAELLRLQQVEDALRAWPLEPLRHDLTRPVLGQLAREPRTPAWQWLPWQVWLPALVIALALGLALAAHMTGQPLATAQAMPANELPSTLIQTPPLSALQQPLSASGSALFWAIWCGLFVTLAGLGVSLGLSMDRSTLDEASAELRERWEHLREAAHF